MVNRQRLRNIFFQLVRTDSPSGDEGEIVREVLDYLKKMKLKPSRDRAGNIFVRIPGKGNPLLLEAHLDTVEPGRRIKPYQKGEYLYSRGDNILGADDKASVAIILELLHTIQESEITHRPLEIIFSVGEEVGLAGISQFDFREVKAREAIGMDRAKPVGVITAASPYIKSFELTIIGKAAHGGAEPEKGINAIQIASRVISRLKLGRIDSETTMNIGLINGGQGSNIVPEKVVVQGDARSTRTARLQRMMRSLEQIALAETKKKAARYQLKIVREVAGYQHRSGDVLIKKVTKAMRVCGLRPRLLFSSGASDLNEISKHKIKVVELANGVQHAHTKNERVRLNDLVKMVQLLLEVCK